MLWREIRGKETKKYLWVRISILNMEEVTFTQRPKGSRKWVMKITGGRAVQVEEPPIAKGWRQERAQSGKNKEATVAVQ